MSEHMEHGRHAGHSYNIFKTKFWVSLALSIPLVFYAGVAQDLLNYRAPVFPGLDYLQLLLASVVFFYGGWIFLASAWRELGLSLPLRRASLAGGKPGMMTLISLAIITAYAWSVYAVFFGKETLFWELATLITVMLLGHWMEMRAVKGASGALRELSKLLPDTAEIIVQKSEIRNPKFETNSKLQIPNSKLETKIIPVSELRENDVVLVRPGGRIPADGAVKEGESEVDESLVTGESKPVAKKEGDAVIAGTINGDGALKVVIAKIGDETFLAGVMRLVAEAEASKSRLQTLADRAAFYLTFVAVFSGAAAFFAWLFISNAAFAINRMVAVLVIACPHALGLAIPLVASISTTKAAQNGFLVKRRLALEAARNIDTVLFDKTGTLTEGKFGVDGVIAEKESGENFVLQLAASANASSEHPIAKAIVAEAEKRNLPLLNLEGFRRVPGKGVRAEESGKELLVGNRALLLEKRSSISGRLEAEALRAAEGGKTVNFVIFGGVVAGVISLSDVIREESREAVNKLKKMKIKVAMITGDAEDAAKWVAEDLGIEEYFAKVLPGQKSEKVKLLQDKGNTVAFVGDGVNDAPALAQADLGVAIGAGTNVAIESAGIILVRDDPRDIVKIIKLSRFTYSKMIQNLFWAAGYNVLAIPLAAGALAAWGIFLQPAAAAILMSLSTVIVAVNAMLLRQKKL